MIQKPVYMTGFCFSEELANAYKGSNGFPIFFDGIITKFATIINKKQIEKRSKETNYERINGV